MIAKALEVLPSGTMNGGDIACGLRVTVGKSSLAAKVAEKQLAFVVNAFHGYAHNYRCQIENHPSVVKGVGLEDFEGMERIFSGSNPLAGLIRYASTYRRRMSIHNHYEQWDEDKYENLASFILGNYKQALKILAEDTLALEEAKESLKITDENMDLWEVEQVEFFANVGKEPEAHSLRVEYVEHLQSLRAAGEERTKANSALYNNIGDSTFVMEDPSNARASYSRAASATQKLETKRRLANERFDILLNEVINMEVRLSISRRWGPGDPEYNETLKYIAERRYHRALDKVHQLVIQRLFELQKLNIAGTGKFHISLLWNHSLPTHSKGYKTRTHVAKSLQTRCKAIRRAVANYNAAAAKLTPPRESLDMADISHYGFVAEFSILKDTRNDIRDKPWSKPLYREVLKLRQRIARAQEEITRCNVETRRLHTSILDEARLFSRVLRNLESEDSPLYGPFKDFATRRRNVNNMLMKRIQMIHGLRGFTGEVTRGVRLGSEDEEVDDGHEDESLGPHDHLEGIGRNENENDSEDALEDDELRGQIQRMDSFMQQLDT